MTYNYNPQYFSPYSQQKIICEYVQGESAAKSYPVAPGQFAVLLDIENPVIYTKTVDQFGRPSPIKILDYKERSESPEIKEVNSDYVTKEDLDSFKKEIKDLIRQFSRPNNYKKGGNVNDK